MGYKVKRIYVGTTKVRPSGYEYSYDFGGKTWSQCQTDGWYDRAGNTPLLDSNGIYYNSWAARPSKDLGSVFTNAKKITIEVLLRADANFGMTGGIGNSSTGKETGFYTETANHQTTVYGTNVQIDRTSLGTGWYTQTSVFDLEKLTYTQNGYFSMSGTLTNSQVTNIKSSNSAWLLLASSGRIKEYHVKVEY